LPVLEHTGRRALSVDPGEVISILAAPGSGKTRLGLELAFLMKPNDGEVLFRGRNPMGGSRRRARASQRPREVTLLVQNAEDQLFARTVFDDVAFGPRHLGLDEAEIERRVSEAIRTVGLDPAIVRDRSPFALSGGERRRAALAGVLAMEPEVLILDEPTSNLDPRTRDHFLDLLEPLRDKGAVIWLTTSASEAARTDRIYVLRDGATYPMRGGTDFVREWRQLAAAGIELPAVYELAGAMERRGCLVPETGSPAALRDAIVQAWQSRNHDR
jgi:energy-coupling factor transporter ATP-binding protein EcfA2